MVGNEVRLGLENLGNSDVSNPTISVGVTHLFVARLTLNASGNEILDLWIDPDVSSALALGALGSLLLLRRRR